MTVLVTAQQMHAVVLWKGLSFFIRRLVIAEDVRWNVDAGDWAPPSLSLLFCAVMYSSCAHTGMFLSHFACVSSHPPDSFLSLFCCWFCFCGCCLVVEFSLSWTRRNRDDLEESIISSSFLFNNNRSACFVAFSPSLLSVSSYMCACACVYPQRPPISHLSAAAALVFVVICLVKSGVSHPPHA